MKKIFAIIFAIVMASAVFAESYKVVEFAGPVKYESAKGTYEEIKIGQEFMPSTQIKVPLNSSLIIEFNGKQYSIPAKNNGPIDELCAKFPPNERKGLKKYTIAKSDKIDNATGKREGVSTASARASEAKEDLTWDE